jgi:hypothetical protein
VARMYRVNSTINLRVMFKINSITHSRHQVKTHSILHRVMEINSKKLLVFILVNHTVLTQTTINIAVRVPIITISSQIVNTDKTRIGKDKTKTTIQEAKVTIIADKTISKTIIHNKIIISMTQITIAVIINRSSKITK